METATRNRLIIAAAVVAASLYLGYHMFFSLTPPRHADHDHAMATLDAGGFLRLEAADGSLRNLVGRPGKVLILHWFRPDDPNRVESRKAAGFATTVASDPEVEVLLVASGSASATAAGLASELGLEAGRVYLDREGKVANLIGVRRFPETLIYDPAGLLAHQARGVNDWSRGTMQSLIATAKAGVEEIH